LRKKKKYSQIVKHIYHSEIKYCLECKRRLKRYVTISDKRVVTLTQVVRVIHCGYRCPEKECRGNSVLYRSAEADALSLSGFTFGLDIVLKVGHLRLVDHKTIDEIHHSLLEQLVPLEQTISRREILFLFEAYTSLLRAGTETSNDEAWKEQVRENEGLLLSIDGIQPDAGNETIYLVRDVFTGRILNAENTTESTKERLKQILAPIVALNLPVIGAISDAQTTELQAIAELWPDIPHQICQFHVLRDAGRLISQFDVRVRNDMRARMKQKTHEYRQNLQKRLKEAETQEERNEQEREQLSLLEEYAAVTEGALQIGSLAPFRYGSLEVQEALIHLQESLEALEKKEET
jgi:hypothetical protein